MANKKITVVGDGVEEPLSPEEEHRIEVKIDEMLDPTLPDAPLEVKIDPVPAAQPGPVKKVVEPVAVPQPEPKIEAAPSEAKVTKIVPTFADEPDTEPQIAEVKTEAAAPTPPAPEPAPIKKKITVMHHDDSEDEPVEAAETEVPEEPAPTVEAPKPKAATKKTAKSKKKVVVTDKPDKDDLASKADAIAASALAAEELMGTKSPTEKVDAEPETQATEEPSETEGPEAEEATDDLPETTNDEDGGAPPLIRKHSVAPITVTDSTVEAVEDSSDETEPVEAGHKTEITIDEPLEEAEKMEVEVEPPTEPTEEIAVAEPETVADTSDAKKYRPPDGPIQFKRAEVPIEPHKPGEPRATEATPTEISEDAALAKAFETTKATRKGDVARGLAGAALKLLKWVLILLVVGAIIAVAAVPSLRTKALNLVGIHKTKSAVTSSKTTPSSVAPVATTPANPDIYLAKRAGTYNLYKIEAGGPEKLILTGTGKEEADLALASNAKSTFAALVSTRDGKADSGGTIQQSMTLVNTADGTTTAIDSADEVKLVDWFDDRIVYVLLNNSTSTTDTNRYQIVSYDVAKKVRTVIDHASYLNDVLAAKGSVYYATASGASGSGQVMKVQPDGSSKRSIQTAEVADISRVSYGSLILSATNKWYSYELGAVQASTTNNVSQGVDRLYLDNPNAKRSAYISDAGGTAKLIVVDTATGKETTLSATDVSYPIHWLSNDTLVYRNGNSDHSINVSGGQATKLADVFDAAGISLWHEQ